MSSLLHEYPVSFQNENSNLYTNMNESSKNNNEDAADLHEFYLVYWDGGDNEKKKLGTQSLSEFILEILFENWVIRTLISSQASAVEATLLMLAK